MMRVKGNKLVWAGVLLVVALVCAWCIDQSNHEKQTMAQFQADRLQMEELAFWVLERGSHEDVKPPRGWESIRFYNGRFPVVEFSMGASGFGSETTYWGVNYVPDDELVGFQGQRWDHWKAKDDGRLYYDPEGDNQCYVKKLDTNWYYYEISF